MGWSCSADAGDLVDVWSDLCFAQTGTANGYIGKDGIRRFYEISRTEHHDGAITGTVWQYVNDSQARKAGTFRVDGDGETRRMPASWPFDRRITKKCPTCGAMAHRGDQYCNQCGHYVFA